MIDLMKSIHFLLFFPDGVCLEQRELTLTKLGHYRPRQL